jgi:BirA family transcriptional regulator, biotin operon repressor / biotin---[acetyl-CoA-carboxylase] ligase
MKTAAEQLDPDIIQRQLTTKYIGRQIVVYKSTSSTNDIAWQYANNPANNGLAVFAENQTKGRGTRGRKWYDRPGQSILCSIMLADSPLSPETLTLASAAAINDAIEKSCKCRTLIKWPNDILLDGRKLAGILVEARGKICVIGIGINCRQRLEEFPPEIKDIAISLDAHRGEPVDRAKLAAEMLNSLERTIEKAAVDPDQMINRWQRRSSLLGQRISIKSDNRVYTGNCIGIDPLEGLILQLDAGPVRMFHAAHSTIV